MKVLITGATGFIGGKLAERLMPQADELVLLVRPGTAASRYARFAEAGARIEPVALHEPEALRRVFSAHRFDVVYHLAALRGGRPFPRADYFASNVIATELLAREAAGQKARFVFCSSVGIWGAIPRELPAGESTPRQGDSYYHYTKIEAEARLRVLARDGLEVVIVRPVITYGTGDYGFPYSLIKLIDQGLFVRCSRDVQIHLGDVQVLADAFVRAARADVPPGSAYTVADREPVCLRDLVDLISRRLKGRAYPRWKCLPGPVFDLASVAAGKLAKNEVWKARFELISKSWYYNVAPAQRDLKLDLADTLERFGYVVDAYLGEA